MGRLLGVGFGCPIEGLCLVSSSCGFESPAGAKFCTEWVLEFSEQVLEWSRRVPIFILTLARPELATRREGWPAGRRGATVIDLEPLPDPAMRALLSGVVQGLPAGWAGRIVARAEGVPLFAVETVRALADRGVLRRDDGRLVASGDLGELEVPASLNALVVSRLDALEPDERELVRALSVFAGAFPRRSAVALTGLDQAAVERTLAGLVRKQVLMIGADPLSPDRGQYAFAQGMLRTVAYGMLPRRERKQQHLPGELEQAAMRDRLVATPAGSEWARERWWQFRPPLNRVRPM